MRKSILYLIVTVFIISNNFLFAQNRITLQKAAETAIVNEQSAYPVDARPFLDKLYKATGFDPEQAQPLKTTLKKAAWNFYVGYQKSWRAGNFSTNAYYDVPSTCRKVGTNCYIFVEDAIWGTSVNEAGVDSVALAFDSKTPTNPNKGIYQTNVEVFGLPPDVDGDPKIIILILDIIDGATGGGYISGYFTPVNEVDNINSNRSEFYYLDGVQNNLTTPGGVKEAMSTAAHEFQHMIHYNSIPIATTFFNECFSLTAEIICGYGLYNPLRYVNESNRYLTSWRDNNDPNVYTDYSRAARYGLYLLEQYGTAFFTKYLEKKRDGITGITNTISDIGGTRTFYTLLPDWFIANYLNDKNLKAEWGYSYPNLMKMAARVHANPNVTYSDKIYNHAVQYISFTNGSNLTVNIDNKNDQYLKVKAIKYGQSTIEIEDVTPKTDYTVSEFGSSVSNVVFVLYYVDPRPLTGQGPFDYSYTATGEFESSVQELAYDETEPTGYLKLTAGDSVAVIFSGVSGAKLDSIKVAVRNLVPVPGSVYEYKGLTSGFAGRKLASFTATPTISSSPDVIDSTGTYPYEQPYKNWVKVDLRSTSIPVDNSFTVIFPVEGVYPTKNRIMTTYYQSTSSYNSFWFSTSNDSWLYYRPEGKEGYIFLNLIRAYVSLVTDAKEVIELLPSSYSLEQNYPNPFNPSTIINYQLPKSGNVQIKIFDALGREVRSLINEEKSAGKYNILWDSRDNYGSKVSSGVYFYTITSGDFAETKKMVLLK